VLGAAGNWILPLGQHDVKEGFFFDERAKRSACQKRALQW
jgi:hypothetical protein